MRRVVVAAIVVVAGGLAGCVECETATDCGGGSCVEGACVAARRPLLRFLSPSAGVDPSERAIVGERFDAVLEVSFVDGPITVRVDRSATEPGDACVPFAPAFVSLSDDGAGDGARVVVVRDLPALGESFSLQASVAVLDAVIIATLPLRGPPTPAALTGIDLIEPAGTVVNVTDTPFSVVVAQGASAGVAFAEPVGGRGNSTPKTPLTPQAGLLVGEVPTLRGSHVVWVEAEVDGTLRRCGRAIDGGPALALGAIDVTLRSVSAEPAAGHWVEVATRVLGASDDGEAFCDGRTASEVECAEVQRQDGVAVVGTDGLEVGVSSGVIEVAAVPRATSGPVVVTFRVSDALGHVALFGPATLRPAEGETWLAGRLFVQDGVVTTVVPDAAGPAPGLPW